MPEKSETHTTIWVEKDTHFYLKLMAQLSGDNLEKYINDLLRVHVKRNKTKLEKMFVSPL